MLASSTRISRALRHSSLTCCSEMGWLSVAPSRECLKRREWGGEGRDEPILELFDLTAGKGSEGVEEGVEGRREVYRSRFEAMVMRRERVE